MIYEGAPSKSDHDDHHLEGRAAWVPRDPVVALQHITSMRAQQRLSAATQRDSGPDAGLGGVGGERVHVVPPMYDLAILDGYDRDEPVVVGVPGSDLCAMHLIFEDHDPR